MGAALRGSRQCLVFIVITGKAGSSHHWRRVGTQSVKSGGRSAPQANQDMRLSMALKRATGSAIENSAFTPPGPVARESRGEQSHAVPCAARRWAPLTPHPAPPSATSTCRRVSHVFPRTPRNEAKRQSDVPRTGEAVGPQWQSDTLPAGRLHP